ncbi:NOL7 protein, partial [Mionectes macconnelli]|nr:NOL7 protein [Mionectes macconnelli]
MARPKKAAAAAGKRRAPTALPSPASSSEEEDEAPEQVSFGLAREAAQAERKLVGEAARRHRELLKEKRRRHQELFAEQKVQRRPLPTRSLPAPGGRWANARLTPLSPAEAEAAARGPKLDADVSAVLDSVTMVKGFTSVFLTRSKGNYAAVCLKDQSLTGLHQELAKDFLNTQLYGPHTNRVQANEFFSLANKKDPVKKAAVQFVDKSWGEYKKPKWVLLLHIW